MKYHDRLCICTATMSHFETMDGLVTMNHFMKHYASLLIVDRQLKKNGFMIDKHNYRKATNHVHIFT